MTEPTQSTVVWLTQAKYDELKAELEELRGPTRSALVKRVSDARDEGDLKENAGYHAARDELGKIDGRIQQLVDMLERAEVGETPADDGVVEPGMKVTVLLGGDRAEVPARRPRDGRRGHDIDVFSPQSPLGQAINGARTGETVDYEAPNGKQIKVEIVDAVPYVGLTPTRRAGYSTDVVAVLPQPRRARRRACSGPFVSSWRWTSTSPTCSAVDVRSWATSSTLAPTSASSASRCASPPGRSGITQRRLR